MTDINDFADICPYSDSEAIDALKSIAMHPYITQGSLFVFPDQEPDYLKNLLLNVTSIDDFQQLVMSKLVERVIETTVHNFSYDGMSNLENCEGKSLLISNHRDIILDPAITQLVLFRHGLPMSEIAVGSNLISNKFIEALMRSNRMIKVIRGISSRELYMSSQILSRYIRQKITSGESSIWLAQRQGRTKNGTDLTEQGLLKMLDMSGQGDFRQNFEELNITPLSISYEYESCDYLKAREILISRDQKYVKQPGEDWFSIMTGIKQKKGNIHLNIGKRLTPEEIAAAAMCDKNDRYQLIRHAVDLRVIDGYKLWKTNFIAYDMLYHCRKYADRYTPEERKEFGEYVKGQLAKVEQELDHDELKYIFLGIYANPITSKKLLQMTV